MSNLYSDQEAVEQLGDALRDYDEFNRRTTVSYWGLSLHEEQDRDRAVARVKEAVRYLVLGGEEETDAVS